jgi:hypothetical protein
MDTKPSSDNGARITNSVFWFSGKGSIMVSLQLRFRRSVLRFVQRSGAYTSAARYWQQQPMALGSGKLKGRCGKTTEQVTKVW